MRFEQLHEALADRAGGAEDGDRDALGFATCQRASAMSVFRSFSLMCCKNDSKPKNASEMDDANGGRPRGERTDSDAVEVRGERRVQRTPSKERSMACSGDVIPAKS